MIYNLFSNKVYCSFYCGEISGRLFSVQTCLRVPKQSVGHCDSRLLHVLVLVQFRHIRLGKHRWESSGQCDACAMVWFRSHHGFGWHNNNHDYPIYCDHFLQLSNYDQIDAMLQLGLVFKAKKAKRKTAIYRVGPSKWQELLNYRGEPSVYNKFDYSRLGQANQEPQQLSALDSYK